MSFLPLLHRLAGPGPRNRGAHPRASAAPQRRKHSLGGWLLLAVGCLSPAVGRAGVPQPPCVFYGQARDPYGFPYVSEAEVILRVGGQICSRWPIAGILAPGVNFKLVLPLDDGTGTAYASYAAHPGQAVSITVSTSGGERPIIETRALAVGQPGDVTGIYVTTGTDANADGLPDEWEQLLVDYSGGALSSINQVRPGDDLDRDGVSNLDEYRAGTYAFLSEDSLRLEDVARMPSGRLRMRILTTRGISYQVYATSQPGAGAAWHPVQVALTDTDGAAAYDAVVGDGNFISVYVNTDEPVQFYRLAAQ